MKKSKVLNKLFILALALSFYTSSLQATELTVLPFELVKWGHLNPARGDASPRAADLWGDRTSINPTGMLVRFNDGFSSPPHIHNVTYRGVVIRGCIHNDDPKAQKEWLPPGSFWVQPAGKAHITSAQGKDSLAYIEIDRGPYLVLSTNESFNSGERSINVDHSKHVWLNATDLTWLPNSNLDAKVSFLWGERDTGKHNGSLLKLPTGFSGTLQGNGTILHAVIIKGQLNVSQAKDILSPGSYFCIKNKQAVNISTRLENDAILYIRSDGQYALNSNSTDE